MEPGVGIRDRVPGLILNLGLIILKPGQGPDFRDSVPGTDNFPRHGSGPVLTPVWNYVKTMNDS